MDFFLNFFNDLKNIFTTFTLFDAIDVIIVALLIFGFIKLIRETRAEQLVKGIIMLLIVWLIATQLHLKMLNSLLSNFFQFSVLAIIMIFQPEIRHALEKIGRTKVVDYIGTVAGISMEEKKGNFFTAINEICKACLYFSKNKTGALIIFERVTKLKEIADTGTYINADISSELIENIFFNKSPLHDGAMIIRNSSILAAGCILPLTKNIDLTSSLGTRHRAAMGMSENSDAVVLVVSEETGTISIVENGSMTRNYSEKTLKDELIRLLSPTLAKSDYNPDNKKSGSSIFRRREDDSKK
ncbi:MAG: diadenylate cyclase CdaA [Clostridia bacterium]|nr:diadenylate cyclase CdaA [Clostridia bacterium]